MTTPSATEEAASKFGLEAVPENVRRLTEMIAKRGGNMDEFAKLISQDKDLVERLLCAANPRATRKQDYIATTAEEALQRIGMSFALLLAMSEPLARAARKTFATMLQIELQPVPQKEITPFKEEHVLGEVGFEGKTTGLVHLRLPVSAGVLFGQRLLGLAPEDLADPEVANDVIGEICNMIVGNFKSNLCDAGLTCKLSPPKIARTTDFKLHAVKGGTSERLGFRAPEVEFFIDLIVNPWIEFSK